MKKNIYDVLRENNVVILDIRTYDEFCSGHICGAKLVSTPLPPLNNNQLHTLRKKLKEIVEKNPYKKFAVYCKKGIRAGLTVNILKSMNINVVSLGGVLDPALRDYIKENACYCYN